MIMKKQIISWGMMLAAAFTLTNCAKEIEGPAQEPETNGYPFEIVASAVSTKTVNDGMATKWVDNDKINLFHAEAGGTDYKNDNAFTVADVEAGRFTGELSTALETGKKYDWYAIYPYSDKIATPGERTTGYTYIGHSKGLNQTGYNSTDALDGSNCPFYGVAKSVDASSTPSIDMKHLTSVVAINVTNTTDTPVTITTASLTALESIVGSYYIDITGESVVYNESDSDHVYNTATVNVSGGTALAKGESAILYLAIKPFTAAAGSKLVLSVNENCEKELEMPKDVKFTAGKIKTLNFSYDTEAEPEPANVTWNLTKNETSEATADRIAWTSDYAEMYSERVKSSATAANNYYGADTNNRTSTRFYANNTLTISPKSGYEITSVVFSATSENYAAALKNSNWTNASAEVSGQKITVTPTDGAKAMVATLGGTCGCTSVVVYYVAGEGGATPAITVQETLELPATASTGTVPFTYENIETIEVGSWADEECTEDCDWLSAEVTEGGFKYTAEANESAEERVAYIRIADEELTVVKVVTVTQEAGAEAEAVKMTVAEFKEAMDGTLCELTGTITGIVTAYNSDYNNISFNLSDGTGVVQIYRMSCAEMTSDPSTLTVGDEITVQGTKSTYSGSAQMAAGGKYVSHTDKEAPSVSIIKKTVAEFLELTGAETDEYELTGVITEIYQAYDSNYGNISFYINDGTGTVLIFRMTCDSELANAITVGDEITVQGKPIEHNGTIQMAQGGICINHKDSAEAPTITCTENIVTIIAETGADIYYTTNGDEPTEASTKYTSPFKIDATCTVKAIAVASGKVKSATAEKECVYYDPNAGGPIPSETPCYTLYTSSNTGGTNVYATDSEITVDGITWIATGNTTMSPWRIGGKSIENEDRNVYTITAYTSPLSKVEFVSGTVGLTWNSLTLVYSTNADFTNAKTITATGIGANKTITFAPTDGFPANCYYKFVINVTNTNSSNKYLQLNQIVFYGYEN